MNTIISILCLVPTIYVFTDWFCFTFFQWYGFEFVVMCIGKYGDIPKMPVFPVEKGPEVFTGKVMHSLDYCKLNKEEASQLMKGKKVVVIGYKKSAIDLAVECAEANQGIHSFNSLLMLKLART